MANNYTSRQERRRQQKKKKSHGKKSSRWKKILLSMLAVVILMVVASSIAVAVVIYNTPSLTEDDLTTPQSTRIYDQDEEHVSTLFHEENRVKVDIDDVPEEVKNAFISIEDKRFYDHHGLDFRRLFGAVFANIKNGWGSEGGSTLTQQVIKRSVLTPEKTLKRKIQEAWLSLRLERNYSKEQILEMYINNVYFGNGAYGLQTAAKAYFEEEDLSELSVSQAALLAGLPNAPTAADPYENPERAEKRRNQVLTAMVDNKVISQDQADEAKDEEISDIIKEKDDTQQNDDPYNAFIDTVYDQLVNEEEIITEKEFYQGGLKIYTTLDSDAQQSVYDLLHSDNIAYPDDEFETGISLVDTQTGDIKAVGGGRNFKSIRDYNYGAQSLSQSPGSTIKPILDYGPAIEHLNWPTSHNLVDEEYQYSDGTPINEWDGEYWGDVSMRRALEWSRNIPALKAFQEVGPDNTKEFAKKLGIDVDTSKESTSIGAIYDVSPLQLATAYAAFGNGGTYNEPSAVQKVVFPDGEEWEPEPESHKAMQDYTAYMITDMLRTVISSGTGTGANIEGLPVVGKTGSTNIPEEIKQEHGIMEDGLRDSLFAGYTTQYSLAVWTGYTSLSDEHYIREDGSDNIAKQIFRQLMSEVSDPNVEDFSMPDSVVSNGSELYVRGTQPEPSEEPSDDEENDQEDEDEEEDEEDQEDEVKDDEEDDENDEDAEDEEEDEESNEDDEDEDDEDDHEDEQDEGQDEEQSDQEEDTEEEQDGDNEEDNEDEEEEDDSDDEEE